MTMVAGRDGTSLFDKYHQWVNIDFIMEKCLIGYLVDSSGKPVEGSVPEEEEEDETDDVVDEEALKNAMLNANISQSLEELD
mmetsp:Transcript_9582/g.15021  ORF Transcript_9582/g.15021 Transcript_9582/m.15021 type:complete len:82 (-) Transcript_9582:177-422(-)